MHTEQLKLGFFLIFVHVCCIRDFNVAPVVYCYIFHRKQKLILNGSTLYAHFGTSKFSNETAEIHFRGGVQSLEEGKNVLFCIFSYLKFFFCVSGTK